MFIFRIFEYESSKFCQKLIDLLNSMIVCPNMTQYLLNNIVYAIIQKSTLLKKIDTVEAA